MREYRNPERVTEGQLLWLELEEFPDRPRIVVRVFSVQGLRVEVYALGGDDTLIRVDRARLFEEIPR